MSSQNQEDVIDLKEILGVILARKWFIIGVAVFFAVLAFGYLQTRLPTYQTNLLININQKQGQSTRLDSLAAMGMPSGGVNAVQKQIQIIQSRSVLVPVIKKLNLNIKTKPPYFPLIGHPIALNYDQNPRYDKPSKPYMGLDSYSWGGESVDVDFFKLPDYLKGQKFKIVYQGENQYALKGPDGRTLGTGQIGEKEQFKLGQALIRLKIADITAYQNRSFTLIKQRMNTAFKKLQSKLNIQEEGGGGQSGSGVLKLTYQGHSPSRTAEILNAIGNSAIENEIERKSRNASKVLAFLKDQLPQVREQLTKAEKRVNEYRSQTGSIAMEEEAQILLEKLAKYDSRISKLQLKRSKLSQQLTSSNPELQKVKAAIDKLKSQKAKLESRIKDLPQSDQVAINLMREVKVQEKIYKNLLQKIQRYEMRKAGTVGSLELIQKASVSYQNTNKSPKLIIALAVFLGVFLAIAWIFIRQYLFNGIDDPDEIENSYDLKLSGILNTSRAQIKQEKDYSNKKLVHLAPLEKISPEDITVEGFKSLKTHIDFNLKQLFIQQQTSVILLSSLTQGEGKTFVSINLSYELSSASKETGVLSSKRARVLLIDGDLRRPKVNRYFELSSKAYGVKQLLQGHNIESVIHQTEYDNLDVMPAGTTTDTPIRHLANVRRDLLENIKKPRYDYIVIDTPPILPISDAFYWLSLADYSLLILKANAHDHQEMAMGMKKLSRHNRSMNGFVFNQMPTSNTYYGNKYGYRYRYRDSSSKNKE